MGTESCRSQGKSNERKECALEGRYIGDVGACRFRLFERATSAKGAKWVEESLRKGDWTNVASVVPSNFEAHAAILYPAWHCVCTEEHAGKYAGGPEDFNRVVTRSCIEQSRDV